ncbi:MAG TPA: glycosyltransferase family 39 protein [Candidatus Omnitrophota bacterium]|nr:glycosyltransferase family 39 protein [Candidatus Omnitrophota bacterium]
MNTQPLQRGSQDPITKRRWALVLMMAGVGLRLAYFFQNPPLWLDEINVTLPALHVPFRAFLSGGFAHSTVPIKPALFNIILKASLTFFGNAEWSARLWPLAAGCVSVPLFYAVASRYLNRAGALLALNFSCFLRL